MTQVLHLSSWWNKCLISLFLAIQSNLFRDWHVVTSGVCDVFYTSIPSLSFSLLFFQQFRSTRLLRMPSKALLSQKLAVSSPFFYFNDPSSILSSGGIVMLLSSLIVSKCEVRVLFVLIHLSWVLCPLLKFFSPYQVLHLFSAGVPSEFVLPCSSFLTKCFQLWSSPLYSFLEIV